MQQEEIEFYEQIRECERERKKLYKQYTDNQKKIDGLVEKHSKFLLKKYDKFIGKKVYIIFKVLQPDGTYIGQKIGGFLKGFAWRKRDVSFVPVINKLRKDGGAAKAIYDVSAMYTEQEIHQVLLRKSCYNKTEDQ